ncbi:MAG: class I SAM-dependent methyltransferase [Bacteriovoracaceae bacterium]|nr:class I SAM-dependent methyltransferase [Bacteriovoracaceae bacterium]
MKPNLKSSKHQLHPHSIKYLNLGHPWIIKDTFTEKFNPEADFIISSEFVLLNDPEHNRIKARLWQKTNQSEQEVAKNFEAELVKRIVVALKKRQGLPFHNERENFFWIFSEADFLPGLQLLSLNKNLIISFYAYYWKKYEDIIVKVIQNELPNHTSLWIQYRSENQSKQTPPKFISGKQEPIFLIEEFGLKYNIEIGNAYDFGIYTDMASIRKQMGRELFAQKSVLNLFSYTGAFTLQAMKYGAKHVASVDSSSVILSVLEKNLATNFSDISTHQSVCKKAEAVLRDYAKNKTIFDTIICDPPSAFYDGKKRKSVKDFYQEKLMELFDITAKNGNLIVFCNTHTFSEDNFVQLIKKILGSKPFKIKTSYRLGEDCLPLKNFPEGNYLKGICIQKN